MKSNMLKIRSVYNVKVLMPVDANVQKSDHSHKECQEWLLIFFNKFNG